MADSPAPEITHRRPALSAESAVELAYGLLWCVSVDLSTASGTLVRLARQELLEQLDRDGQARGITAARQALESRKNPRSDLRAPH